MRKKCNAAQGKWCQTVEEVFKFKYPTSAGLHIINTRNHGMLYCVYRKGFIWLNFCPFCGEKVRKKVLVKKKGKT